MTCIDQAASNDCLSACVASLFEIPLEDVPVFATPPEEFWQERLDDWLAQYNLRSLLLLSSTLQVLEGAAIVCGKSPRGDYNHCSVYDSDGKLVWDPHPTQKIGVESISYVVVFVALRLEEHGRRKERYP